MSVAVGKKVVSSPGPVTLNPGSVSVSVSQSSSSIVEVVSASRVVSALKLGPGTCTLVMVGVAVSVTSGSKVVEAWQPPTTRVSVIVTTRVAQKLSLSVMAGAVA